MTRQVIYGYYIKHITLEQMPMNEFEEEVMQIKDIRRLVSETMQLENYLFRHPEPPKSKDEQLL